MLQKGKNKVAMLMAVVVFAVFLAQFASSLAISPANKIIDIDKGSSAVLEYTIFSSNSQELSLNAQLTGPIKNFAALENEEIKFKKGEKQKSLKLNITIPKDIKASTIEGNLIVSGKDGNKDIILRSAIKANIKAKAAGKDAEKKDSNNKKEDNAKNSKDVITIGKKNNKGVLAFAAIIFIIVSAIGYLSYRIAVSSSRHKKEQKQQAPIEKSSYRKKAEAASLIYELEELKRLLS